MIKAEVVFDGNYIKFKEITIFIDFMCGGFFIMDGDCSIKFNYLEQAIKYCMEN